MLRDFLLRAVADRRYAPRLRVSQAGSPCERAVYYAATGAEGEDPRPEHLVKMALGSALDSYLLKDSPPWRFQVPVSLECGELVLGGTADAVLYGEDGSVILVSDLKTVGLSTWTKIQNEPKREHRAQVQLYAWALGSPKWSVCYVHADTGEILEHSASVDEFEVRRDFGMFESVTYYMKRGEPPPRPYDDIEEDDGGVKLARDQFPCAWCSYRATCWRVEKEMKDGKSVQTA